MSKKGYGGFDGEDFFYTFFVILVSILGAMAWFGIFCVLPIVAVALWGGWWCAALVMIPIGLAGGGAVIEAIS